MSGPNNPPLTNNPFIPDTSDPSRRYPDISPTSHPGSRYPDISIPSQSTRWTHSNHPTQPTQPTHPSHPTQPTQPTQPTHPTHATQPTHPIHPTQPTHPTHPTQRPTQPIQPTQPTQPTFSPGGQPRYQPAYQHYPQQHQNISTGYVQQPQPQNFLPSYPQPSQPQITSPFQPSNSLRQNLQPSISGSSYSYLQQGQPQAPQNGYNPVQQRLQNPRYIPQLDPYGSFSQGWADSTSQPHSSPTNAINNTGYGDVSSGPASDDPHPREYMHSHRQEIEAWDGYAWKQFLNTFEALKKAWEARRKELKGKVAGLQAQLQYAGCYNQAQIQQQSAYLQGLLTEADSNFDAVTASTLQMEEAYKGYRQSGDPSSKRRVREATNAAMSHLPNWPGPY